MPRLSFIHFWPYSGHPDRTWTVDAGGHSNQIDENALLRSSRRVCESFNQALVAENVQMAHSEIRLECRGVSTSSDFECFVARKIYDGWEHVIVRIPAGFAAWAPNTRANLVMDVLSAVVTQICELRGVDPAAIVRAEQRARAADLQYSYLGPWRSNPSRRMRARLAGHLHDDGFARLHVEFAARGDDTVVAASVDFQGGTTPRSFTRASKGLAWTSETTVSTAASGPYGAGNEVGNVTVDTKAGTTTILNSPEPSLIMNGDPTAAANMRRPGVQLLDALST